jgi:hypothetical protein
MEEVVPFHRAVEKNEQACKNEQGWHLKEGRNILELLRNDKLKK